MPGPCRALTYGLTANVLVLSVVSLLTDVSSEMILPILPFFLTQVLAADAFIVGLMEGLSEGAVSFMKLVSGRVSDSAGRRKAFVAAGYGLSSVMKVLFPFARGWPEFLGMRVVERAGKGVRDAPRDALLAESTPVRARGKAFGFHRSLDTAGAIAGPLITLGLLATIGAGLSLDETYRRILLLAAIPAIASFLVVFLVREPARSAAGRTSPPLTFRGIPRPLLAFIGIASIFSFADFSYAFLLLKVGLSFGATEAILLYVLFNVVYAAHAFPAGVLSDRVGRKPVILIGYACFAGMGILLVTSAGFATLVLAFILYGLSYGMAEGTQRAFVADLAPPEVKATVLGAFHASVGGVKLASGLVAGFLWIAVAPEATFAFGASGALVAAGALAAWRRPTS
jgi:MFS family permease